MIVVADASVAAKWFLSSRRDEDNAESALRLLEQAVTGELTLRQPPHFVTEVAAVLTRLKPDDALLDIRDLLEVDFERIDDEGIYAHAVDLAIALDHHVFDTLYHAVALSAPDVTLVTADRRYHRKAEHLGGITLLRDWAPP